VVMTVLLASTLGKIFQPFFDAMAWVIAAFYALIPNYAVAIALLTVAVMAVTAPLTIKSTRSMVAMSKLSPAMKELQKKYKNDKVRLNEEMMKLYREHNVSPAAGCVPMLIQFPVFIILYDVIRGLTNTVTVHGRVVAEPRYIGHSTALYTNLVKHPGVMKAFGVNLADTAFSHLSWPGRLPYIGMIAVAIGLQYFQMRQINKRNQNQLNQQMQAMQKFMPLIFAVIYIRIAAGVNVYFIVSSVCRIGLQLWSFRSTPAEAAPRVGKLSTASGGGRQRRTLMERLAEAQQRALEQQAQQRALTAGQPAARSRGGAEAPARPKSGAATSGRPTAKAGSPPRPGPARKASGGAKPAGAGSKGGGSGLAAAPNGAKATRKPSAKAADPRGGGRSGAGGGRGGQRPANGNGPTRAAPGAASGPGAPAGAPLAAVPPDDRNAGEAR